MVNGVYRVVQELLGRSLLGIAAVKSLSPKSPVILTLLQLINLRYIMKSVIDLVDYLIGFSFFSCCSDPPDKRIKTVQTPETSTTSCIEPDSADELFPLSQTSSVENLDELHDSCSQGDQYLTDLTDKENTDVLIDGIGSSACYEAITDVKIAAKHVAKVSNIQARRARRMGSHLRKVNYTGAVGAPPPYELQEIIAPLNTKLPSNTAIAGGIYLTYSLTGNGSLTRIYSTSEPKLDEDTVIIAYSMPKKMISSFKYEKGSELLIGNLGKVLTSHFVNDRKPFYTAWIDYIKVANSYNSTLYLLPEFSVSPPPKVQIVCIKKGDKTISGLPVDAPIVLDEYDVIAALPPGIGAIKIGTTTRSQLLCLTTRFGAIVEL
ncbi:hypothetical protein BMR1_02g02345 [Babesia microti strain RI]|uniref:Immune mapped protein 2 N-terminal domain-containing protein n=1 Tax=Babesia microti (strain RI) TaxID=1133968 RepID=I7J6A4_BABMR|nr:hypothetical protein BMR1_02g02345 [Babesia microti strain RI]CCF73627.1 hypothetical protein BMR1_02g02345 [Babesia microti strain RI]|eukprot:XP_012648236.1 hypothetical protein BMR1_02g02345 [Babesia microti strain RI]